MDCRCGFRDAVITEENGRRIKTRVNGERDLEAPDVYTLRSDAKKNAAATDFRGRKTNFRPFVLIWRFLWNLHKKPVTIYENHNASWNN